MTYKAEQVANYFIEKARAEGKGEAMTPMKVLKLVYIAHGWYLALRDKPLIKDKIEAWRYGPVIPVIYHKVKKYGAESIEGYIEFPDEKKLGGTIPQDDGDTIAFLDRVWEVYGGFDGLQLSSMTHAKDTPWQKVREKMGYTSNPLIPDKAIQAHYEKMVVKNGR